MPTGTLLGSVTVSPPYDSICTHLPKWAVKESKQTTNVPEIDTFQPITKFVSNHGYNIESRITASSSIYSIQKVYIIQSRPHPKLHGNAYYQCSEVLDKGEIVGRKPSSLIESIHQ